MRPTPLLVLAMAASAALPAQEALKVSPEDATNHLIRKVEPVYPAFAEAAGIEGVIHAEVGISANGHVGSIMIGTGPPSLKQAAEDALKQYVYRPFEESAHPVNATTSVDVVFKLEDGASRARLYAVQDLSLKSFAVIEDAESLAAVPPALRAWLPSVVKRSYLDYLSKPEQAAKQKEFLAAFKVLGLPVRKTGAHLYLASCITAETCGATGNCNIELVEEDAAGIHPIASESGWGVFTYFRAGSSYPDIFISAHMSAFETNVAGYANAGGFWGQLYCGDIQKDDAGRETSSVHVCR